MLAIPQQRNNFVAHCCIPNTVSSYASIVMFKVLPQYVTFPHRFFDFIVDPGNASEVLGVDHDMWD